MNKRLREFLLKQWVTIGVPKIAIATFALIKEEKPGDADLGFSKYVAPKSQSVTHCLNSRKRMSTIEMLESCGAIV